MKKVISITTIAIMLFTLILIPTKSSAEINTELKSVINRTKNLFDIGDKYDNFNYSIHSDNSGVNTYTLNWNTLYMTENLSVTIDSTGNVLSYDTTNHRSSLRKIPSIQKSDAIKDAEKFIAKVSPYYSDKVTYYDKEDRFSKGFPSYDLYFIREANDILFPSNYIEANVDGLTGEVTNYRVVWSKNVSFANAKNLISGDQALDLFKNKLGIKLMYKINEVDKKPYLTYSYPYYNEGIDAVTGDVINYSYMDEPLYDKQADATGGMPQSNITPEEQAAIEKSAKLIKYDDVLKEAREFFNLDDTYTVLESELMKSYLNKDQYFWSIQLYKNSEQSSSYSIEINALTGKVVGFSHYDGNYDKLTSLRYNQNAALSIANDYIKQHYADQYNDLEKVDWNSYYTPYMVTNSNMPGYYYFTFKRIVNGAYFQNDGFNVTVDAVTGKVACLDMQWYEGSIPDKGDVISIDKAYDIFLKNNSFLLMYQPLNTAVYDTSNSNINAGLMYSIVTGVLFDVDAHTGELLGISGDSYNGTKTYSDIKGIKQENAISQLCKSGIYLPGDKFNPNEPITQKDFLYLLSKSMSVPIYFSKIQYDNDDSIYDDLIQSGVVKDGEKSVNSNVTKLDAVKFIIRASNLSKAADLNIYKLKYADIKSITPSLRGYVAIAGALNIVNGNDKYFYPNQKLTRADAAVLLYNYLMAD